jgi:hypothetical protein
MCDWMQEDLKEKESVTATKAKAGDMKAFKQAREEEEKPMTSIR